MRQDIRAGNVNRSKVFGRKTDSLRIKKKSRLAERTAYAHVQTKPLESEKYEQQSLYLYESGSGNL